MIILRNIALRRGSKLLLQDANVTVQPGQRLALIGANGCGKSSLFTLLLGELGADTGAIEGMNGLRLSHMAQETHATELPAGEYVWRGDAQLAALRDKVTALESNREFDKAAPFHSQLEEIDGYSAERHAQRLLQGLGFAAGAAERAVSDFSGGWRIRLNLARALMTPSDILLLDEPTNHLDLDATLWLQQWLQQYPGTLLMISHDRDFIDATCERTRPIDFISNFLPTGSLLRRSNDSVPSACAISRATPVTTNNSAESLKSMILCGAFATKPPRRSRHRAGSKNWSACRH